MKGNIIPEDPNEVRQMVEEALKVLNPFERELIKLRFGIGERGPRSRKDVAAIFNTHTHYINILEGLILEKMEIALLDYDAPKEEPYLVGGVYRYRRNPYDVVFATWTFAWMCTSRWSNC